MNEKKDLELSTIEQALMAETMATRDAAILACGRVEIPSNKVMKWLLDDDMVLQMAGLAGSINVPTIPIDLLMIVARKWIEAGKFTAACELLGRTFEKRWLPEDKMLELAESEMPGMRYLAMRAATAKNGGSYDEIVVNGLSDYAPFVALTAAQAARGHTFPLETLDNWRKSTSRYRRAAAAQAMVGRSDIPFRWVAEGLSDDELGVRIAAARAAAERRIPERYIQAWMNDADNGEQVLALIWNFRWHESMQPEWRSEKAARRWLKLLKKCTQSQDLRIALAATRLYGLTNLPLVRDEEVTGLVYKRCLEGVVVLAEIPHTAQIRITDGYDGAYSGRASEACIREVIGDFCGEKVGVAWFDHETQYREGDHVIVEDYDTFEKRLESTGFHFYYRNGLHDDYSQWENLELGY